MLKERIKQKIKKSLPNAEVKVDNFSSEHIGHNPKGAHIQVFVCDSSFEERTVTAVIGVKG